ncbi:MAG: sulfotransferase [Rhizobiales bacterium]|nr:sulfotransferase [Hyphomicrobiales bacterium]
MEPGPDFVCVGAQKAGTQWLYDQLAWHPQFWMPPVKELHYLDRGSFKKHRRSAAGLRRRARLGLSLVNAVRERQSWRPLGPRDLDFLDRYVALLGEKKVDLDGYAGLFAGKGAAISGDVTPGYSRLDEAAIADFAARFPETRILYLARDPIERVWSHLLMTARRGKTLDRVRSERAIKFSRRPVVRLRCTNTEVIARWRRHVPAERVGVFLFDDIRDRPAETRRAILAFLGADPDRRSGALPPGFNRKSKDRKLPMPDDLRAALAEEFADELRASAEMLGGAAMAWPAKYGIGGG